MSKEEFLQQLAQALAPLSDMERARALDFYREMICDGEESGEDEQSLIAGFGTPAEIAAQILEESRSGVPAAQPVQTADGTADSPYTARGPVQRVVVEARHTAVEVRSIPSGPVQVHFVPGENDRVDFREENGEFVFHHTVQFSLFHWHDLFMGPRRIVVDIPADFSGKLEISTCNARLYIVGFQNLTEGQFVTSNAHLTLRGITCGQLRVRTSNGTVDLDALRGSSCTAETSNGRITATDCTFPAALDLYTNNGAIRAQNIVSDNIEFSTNNGMVSAVITGDMREYAIHSHTSNASSSLPPELAYPEQTKHLNVTTSNAKIDVRFVSSSL